MTVKNKMSKAQHTYEKHIILYIVPQMQVNWRTCTPESRMGM